MSLGQAASHASVRAQALVRASVVLVALAAGPALGKEMIGVELDQAKLVKLPDGTSTVVVGNPAIADVTMQKNSVVVITGRRAGRTNFIALDKGGQIISESTVTVSVSQDGRVLVRRGTDSTTYDCSSECLPAAGFGDEEKAFAQAIGQASSRTKEAREAVMTGK